ncbi:DNA circularization N-terminal domain-containing protein, partial [Roseospirillum parvum]
MSWRDQLRPAAFKGVPFEYDEATDTEPRRWVAHESAGADGAAHEALPLHPLKVRLTAYLIGPDHLDQARRLREALKAPEAGTLVHPWLGSVRVVCLDWSQRHTTREGGVSAFQLEFAADDAAAARPVAAIDHAATVEAARESTLTALSEAFQGSFTVADQPGWVVEDSADLLGDLTDRVDAALAPLTDGLAAAQALADAALDLRRRALGLLSLPGDTLGDLADALLGLAPLGRLRALVGTVRQLLSLSLDPDLLGLLGLDGLFGGEITAGRWASPAATTPSRAVQGTNRRALADLWSAAVAVEAAALATRVGYDSSAEVLATRDQVLGALDQ